MKRILFFLLFNACCFTGLLAIEFKHLGIKDGLSDSQINYITRDSQGFMWFSTSYGLNRYDGYTFKVFTRNEQDAFPLPDNSIGKVQEGDNGFLWIYITRTGTYVYYDPEKETFHPALPFLQDKYGIPAEPDHLFFDKDKNIWCHINGIGTYYYNKTKKNLLLHPVNNDLKENNIELSNFGEDKNGILLLYANGYIEQVDKGNCQITYRNNFLVHNKEITNYKLFVDADGDYWIHARNGIWVYYMEEDKWEYLSSQTESPYVLSHDFVADIQQDTNGQVWIATDHGGINVIDKNLHTTRYLKNDLLNERSIVQNSINCLYCDDVGGVWIGSYKRGVSYYNESIYKFRTDHLSGFNHIENFTPDVNVVEEDKQGNLWIGTNNSGLIYLNPETGERKIYQHKADNNSLSGNVIVSMIAARNGRIWIGTYMDGLNIFDGHRFTHYKHNPNNPNSLANDNVWALAEDENEYIWIGTLGSGLQGFDPRTGVFKKYSGTNGEFDREYISSICISKDKNLYMGTNNGITVFSPATKTFDKWVGNRKGTQVFSHLIINDIYEDSRGFLWIATQQGLNIYDRKKDEVIIPVSETLEDEMVYAVTEDNNGNMWVTTISGISNIVVSMEPTTGVYTYVCHRYNEQDGLEDQQFNPHSITKTLRGEIIAGGVQGLSAFDSGQLKYNRSVPKVKFTELQLFNKEVKIDSVYDGNCILKMALNQTPEIRLKYRQNVFSVSFSAMNYVLPEKTQYHYLLDGFNSDWMTADANKLTYTNLTPGKYVLKVQAVNSDGIAGEEVSELRIVIMPPFWQSPLAYVFYALLVCMTLLLARWQILRNERQKFKLIQVEQEAQKKHEIDDMKLQFFTYISHELRTPLTLIISPLENVMKNIKNIEQRKRLEMVHRNAIRLLNLVNQLLDFRKNDVKGHQLNPVRGDVVEFIRTISDSFTEYSEKKNVHLTFFSSVKELTMSFDEDKIGKIIMNLLSNAFKFTPEGGRVDIFLSLLPAGKKQPEQLEIRVSDTGFGIKDENKEHIFERFYQFQHSEGQKTSGSGIGLYLVKEFVKLHGGTISVHDNAGRGSVFIITIPVEREKNEESRTRELPIKITEKKAGTEIPDDISEEIPNENKKYPLILIVDDNDDFRLFMRDSLQSKYRVKEASDGKKAWEIIPALQPDIIVSDVMMPEMDGNELCRLVKTDIRTSHIPLILLTARSAKEQKIEGLESGADDYITKPFDFDILTLRIKKLLQLQQNRQQNFKKQMEVAPSKITITSLDEKLIKKAIQYVEENISRSDLSVEELSQELGMSRVHLYKKLLSITGKTPVEFIRLLRLKRGAQLLRESQQSIMEISYQTGFSNPKYFRKHFKKEFGILPSDYQEREQCKLNSHITIKTVNEKQ